ncbi:unnamed protein product [Protopolystoma xenopodis]|uniref:Uncharacterized protein n=1 Tax=Protopolystoma xenopodis TaxID=117903 RepID=A0A3S5AMG5_9PLAT|nr:unnamed protein product [Protopolystoma xenopodis]
MLFRLITRIQSLATADGMELQQKNECSPDQPFPCKTPGQCISLGFLCDGQNDCDDEYDEDPLLCIASKWRLA